MIPSMGADEYAARIDRSCDYIRNHLAERLDLEALAEVACFSPWHFHRVFSAIVGQTPRDYVEERRLDRAANFLALRPDLSITDIALGTGFSSPSVFSRSFKARFGMTAAEYRACARHEKEVLPAAFPRRRLELPDFDPAGVEVRKLPGYHVACARARSSYDEGVSAAWSELGQWARARDLLSPGAVLLGLPWDNPDITPEGRLSYFACIAVPDGVQGSRRIGIMDIEAGRYGVYRFAGWGGDIVPAYGALYGKWLPRSGYLPDDRPGIELYPAGMLDCEPGAPLCFDICIPVKPY
jgi:AraC family transcriptional regulator